MVGRFVVAAFAIPDGVDHWFALAADTSFFDRMILALSWTWVDVDIVAWRSVCRGLVSPERED